MYGGEVAAQRRVLVGEECAVVVVTAVVGVGVGVGVVRGAVGAAYGGLRAARGALPLGEPARALRKRRVTGRAPPRSQAACWRRRRRF